MQNYIISNLFPNFIANCCDINAQLESDDVHFSQMLLVSQPDEFFQGGENLQPEVRAIALGYIHAEQILATLLVNTQDVVCRT